MFTIKKQAMVQEYMLGTNSTIAMHKNSNYLFHVIRLDLVVIPHLHQAKEKKIPSN